MIRRATLAFAAAALIAGAGCHHGHEPRDEKPGGPEAEMLKLEDEAADAVATSARTYLDARDKNPRGPAPKTDIAARDLALETLMDAANAVEVASRAERIAGEVEADPGRVARIRNTAALLRRAAATAAGQATDTVRSGQEGALKSDAAHLRALLRALKVEILALEREARD